MIYAFLKTLRRRNGLLFVFTIVCLLAAVICLLLMFFSPITLLGTSAWMKPFKFFLSAAIYSSSMGWFLFYLKKRRLTTWFSWMVILVLGFELVYIFWKAAQGELSHFNIATPTAGMMYAAMGIAITLLTLCTAYVGFLFFKNRFSFLSPAYVWGIRLGILLFVIFAFEGGIMASQLTHTVGGVDGSEGLPLTNWSRQYGDLRVSHFMGMHALQLLPLYGYFVSKTARHTIIVATLYFVVAAWLLVQALNGMPLF